MACSNYASIIAIGNPGAGKSTMLNALAEEHLFKSGVSFGGGLTEALHKEKSKKGQIFYDTPGLADPCLRQQAAVAIRDALREGGPYKLLFFLSANSGRLVEQDLTTMKLVLDACEEAKDQYGIVINQIPEGVGQGLKEEKNLKRFVTYLFNGIPENRRCDVGNIQFIKKIDKLEAKNDITISLDEVEDIDENKFGDFVNDLPIVQLSEGKALDIKAESFDQTRDKIEDMIRLMERDKEFYMQQQAMMMDQIRQAAIAKEEMEKRYATLIGQTQKQHSNMLVEFNRMQIQENEQRRQAEIADRKFRSEIDEKKLREERNHSLKQQELEIEAKDRKRKRKGFIRKYLF